jgi:Chitobiase/beta-hexosaminidase C-terminal domain
MISTDGGATWAYASSSDRINWTYSWTVPPDGGTFTILSKAYDFVGNVEIPGPGVTVTVIDTPPTTTANPAGGTYNLRQVVRFSTSEAATVYYTTDGLYRPR